MSMPLFQNMLGYYILQCNIKQSSQTYRQRHRPPYGLGGPLSIIVQEVHVQWREGRVVTYMGKYVRIGSTC